MTDTSNSILPDLKGSSILEYGRKLKLQFPICDYWAALRKVFLEQRAKYIVLDSTPRGQSFTSAAAAYFVDEGILGIGNVINKEQHQITILTLTSYGKRKLKP